MRGRLLKSTLLAAIILSALTISVTFAGDVSSPSFNLLDAHERGVSGEGLSKGTAVPTFDEGIKKDVLELDYSLQEAPVRVWAKSFPPALSKESASTAAIQVRVPNIEQISQISLALEIKGTAGSQSIPLVLKRGWNSFSESIDWNAVGSINEAVFLLNPIGNAAPASGTLYLALEFLAAQTPKQANPQSQEKTSFSLFDATEKGVFNLEAAHGSIIPTFDGVVEKDVLEFEYTAAKGSTVGISAKNFPAELASGSANTLKIGIRLVDEEQADLILARVDLKGTNGTQSIDLELELGWNSSNESIDWNKIGALSELAFVVTPTGEAESVKGLMYVVFDFIKWEATQNSGASKGTASNFGLLDAGEKGVFNIGPSKGSTGVSFDEAVGSDVLRFDYSVPTGSHVGVWTQGFPSRLTSKTADAVSIGVKIENEEQLNHVSVKLEVKGETTWQTISIPLKVGWNNTRELINWNTVGQLKQIVFVVSPKSSGSTVLNPMMSRPEEAEQTEVSEPVSGRLYFDLNFQKLSFLEKNFVLVKVAGAFALALLLAFLAGLFGGGVKQKREHIQPVVSAKTSSAKDLFYGVLAVFLAGMALRIYSLGLKGSLAAGFDFGFLAIALAGMLFTELLKLNHTGKHLSAREVFQNALISGLLAASASKIEILSAPDGWIQALMLNKYVAVLAFLIYHISNAASLSSSKKHAKPITGILIAGTPYLFNWILLVENANLLRSLINLITGGMISAWPLFLETAGRFLVVLGFNEAIVNGIHYATRDRVIKTGKAHLAMVYVSLGVVVAPLIADLGSTTAVAGLPVAIRAIVSVLTVMLSYGGLWGEVYLITGMILDGIKTKTPSAETISQNILVGAKKGMAYSAILMAFLYLLSMILNAPVSKSIMSAAPILVGILAGIVFFPLAKTIIETFDGSLPFFSRVRYSYQDKILYIRGAAVGFGISYMITQNLFNWEMSRRILFGIVVGLVASGGASIIRDIFYASRKQGRIQTWKLYMTDSLLGAFVGGALAFYLDSAQVPVVIEKFKLYTSAGFNAVEYITYPLINKWGRIDLGGYTGGAKLLFLESLAGVINWSIAAWLFAINKVFMEAFFQKDTAPIKFFFSKAGFVELMNHMLYVLRWGLWMSPIIFTFLRMMPEPTWYNQDGAIRTLFAIYHNLTMSPEQFQAWSLKMFVFVLAFDFFRVLIWMDHMGLRVATLVNLSFIGLDWVDERIARFIGSSSAQRYIPEGVKRFATWGPLLIPFYLPRGEAWDYAWGTSEAMHNSSGGGWLAALISLSLTQKLLAVGLGILVCAGISCALRAWHRRWKLKRLTVHELANREYRVLLNENGEAFSELIHKECDITRRAYDLIDPCGRILFLVDASSHGQNGGNKFWPVVGNFPAARFNASRFNASRIEKDGDVLTVVNKSHDVQTTVTIRLPDQDTTAEIWSVTVENLTDKAKQLKVVPYLEWVLQGGLHDRFHTQYARLFPETEYASGVNAVLSWQKNTKSMGILACDQAPEGFLTSRVDFIGRARSIWSPRILETLNFSDARDTAAYPTFDPIGSLIIDATLAPRASKTIQLMVGYAGKRDAALNLIKKHLKLQTPQRAPASQAKSKPFLIGHGEIPSGTPQPYWEFTDNGRKLNVLTPFTPRPFDHALSNEAGHAITVTNRGLHVSSNGNSQQNRLTPDWPDLVTKEIPSEAIYLYDPDQKEWFSPTYHPLNDQTAHNEAEFGVDGTAVFRMKKGTLATELTVFVPPDDPAGIYLLKIKNNANQSRRLRVAPFFQMVLSFQPEKSGALLTRYDKSLGALFFENPRNIFRTGPAFAFMTIPAERVETKRGRFFGEGRGVTRPYLVEQGSADATQLTDTRAIAGFLGTVEVPAGKEISIAVVLGQTDARKQAVEIVRKYKNIQTVEARLEDTRRWWIDLMETAVIKSNQPEFDQLQDWLKYQALAERIWARRGFYQTSGAFGFRDQLQDAVNLYWVEPLISRKQVVLHASQQFIEGDVFHWFFTLTDGRTAFSCRSQASDNPLWLVWSVSEYLKATGDQTILEEMVSYVVSEFPYLPLPKNKQGWGHLYHRSLRADTIYKHCMKSFDLVLDDRMGKNGLPLIRTGDWNDGLDEIGSEGKGESIWLGFFLLYLLRDMIGVIEKKEGARRKDHYVKKIKALEAAIERTWRDDRYLRAIHDDGTEIGVKGTGIWEIDALGAAWAIMAGINPEREVIMFKTALDVLEKGNLVLLGWPALREDTKPYLGRSCKYPEGVRENGMYCHGVQWLIRAARILAERFEKQGKRAEASQYRETAYRLWKKITPVTHVTPEEIEIYGGQPNKQAADILTTYDRGRMIWNGYTGAAGWILRQSFEGIVGAAVQNNELILPDDLSAPRGELKILRVERNMGKSPMRSKESPHFHNDCCGSAHESAHSEAELALRKVPQKGESFTAEDTPGMPGVSGAVPASDFKPRAGGGQDGRPLTDRPF